MRPKKASYGDRWEQAEVQECGRGAAAAAAVHIDVAGKFPSGKCPSEIAL